MKVLDPASGARYGVVDVRTLRRTGPRPTAMDRLCLLGGAAQRAALWREGEPLLELRSLPGGELLARHRAGAALRCVADGTRGRLLLGTELGPEAIGPSPGWNP